MKYTIQTIVCGEYMENAYLLIPGGRKDALLIDPGDDLSALRDALKASDRTLAAILLTHGHFDHLLAAEKLISETGATLWAHAAECGALNDPVRIAYNPSCSSLPCPKALRAKPLDDTIEAAGITFAVLHTPGHTPGSVCYYDSENGCLFSGDTLFRAGFGRCDLPGGSLMQMRSSLRTLLKLPESTLVYSGHGEETSIALEKSRYRL